jgi:phosphopantothenoylcysteine decarboxylase/phosphopantothenate--cysteine ligase
MGYALAEAAWERGAEVLLISGPSALPVPIGVTLQRVDTTADLLRAVKDVRPALDLLIMAAAPADYRPAESSPSKRPRQGGPLQLTLEPTPDILVETGRLRKPGSLTVGFALETGDALVRGRTKLERKELDLIVVNDALEPGAGFEVDTNRVVVLDRKGGEVALAMGSKRAIADGILDVIEATLGH